MSFKIISTGSFLPERIVTNNELSQFAETSDEWITQRVGVRERRVCTTETTAKMAFEASVRSLEMGGVTPAELDMIICATITADYSAPSLACSVQEKLGAECPAMDINAACSGFIYALDTAAGFFSRGRAKKILVVGAERLSRLVNWRDRSTCVIFGDGAGAMVLGEGNAYLSSKLYAKGCDVISIPNHSGDSPFDEKEKLQPYINMNGRETFKFAVKAMCTDITEVIAAAGLQPSDIAWVIAHQANERIIDAAVKKLEILPERFCKNIQRVGNTSAASIPILTDEMHSGGKLKKGDYVVLSGFGGGLTSAACVIQWG